MKLDTLKPGALKLKNYLQNTSNGTASLDDYREVDSKWTKRTIERIAKEYPDIFHIDNDKVSLIKDDINLEAYRETRREITKNLKNF